MIEYYEKPTCIERFMLDELLPKHGKIHLYIAQNDRLEEMILNFKDNFFLSSSPINFISLVLLNNSKIYHNNKNEIFYNINTKKLLI